MNKTTEMNLSSIQTRGDVYIGRRAGAQIPPDVLRRLSELNLWISGSHILMEWAFILGAIWLCSRFWNPFLYICTIFWIGGRQHAIAVMVHDGAHYLLTKRKLLNDWINDVFLAWPLMMTTWGYRSNHWDHHKFTNSEKDPDCLRKVTPTNRRNWEFPTSWGRLLFSLLKEFTGISFVELLKFALTIAKHESRSQKPVSVQIRQWTRLAFYAGFLALTIVMGFWKGLLLFWVVPFLTSFNLCMRIRAIAEHFATENDDPLNISRTTIPAWWERVFFPKNVSYHLEHHLYPSVPFYRLPELHKVLMEQPLFRRKAHVTKSYFGVLRECVHFKGPKRTCLPLPKSAVASF